MDQVDDQVDLVRQYVRQRTEGTEPPRC